MQDIDYIEDIEHIRAFNLLTNIYNFIEKEQKHLEHIVLYASIDKNIDDAPRVIYINIDLKTIYYLNNSKAWETIDSIEFYNKFIDKDFKIIEEPQEQIQQVNNTKNLELIEPLHNRFTSNIVNVLSKDSKSFRGILVNNIPQELKAINNWCAWRYKDNGEGKKPGKPPCYPRGEGWRDYASVDNKETWSSYETIGYMIMRNSKYKGFSFMLDKETNITGIDIDNCITDNIINEFAMKIINMFNSYTEVSPSGRGIRILVYGQIEDNIHNDLIEIYSFSKALTITGHKIYCDKLEHRQNELNKLYERYKPIRKELEVNTRGNYSSGSISAEDIRRMINKSKNLTDSFNGYNKNNYSEQRFNCIRMLLKYSQGNERIVEELFKESPLYTYEYSRKRNHGRSMLEYEIQRIHQKGIDYYKYSS